MMNGTLTHNPLGGYEEYGDYDEMSPHSDAYLSAIDEDEGYFLNEAYGAMLNDGLDDGDEEAAEYAADIIQAEYEAYFLRNKAKGQGLSGFSKGAGKSGTYSVGGQLTLEERKQRIQNLKQKTRCRRCGQLGRWAGDGSCPKGKGKGGRGKGSGSSSGGKGKDSSKSKNKPRQVYFALNEYQVDCDNELIEIKCDAMMARSTVPQQPADGSGDGDGASQASSQWTVLEPPSDPFLDARNTILDVGVTADELLDAMIRQAEDQRRERCSGCAFGFAS